PIKYIDKEGNIAILPIILKAVSAILTGVSALAKGTEWSEEANQIKKENPDMSSGKILFKAMTKRPSKSEALLDSILMVYAPGFRTGYKNTKAILTLYSTLTEDKNQEQKTETTNIPLESSTLDGIPIESTITESNPWGTSGVSEGTLSAQKTINNIVRVAVKLGLTNEQIGRVLSKITNTNIGCFPYCGAGNEIGTIPGLR
ncbi:MAG: hypothetical protein ACFFG0_55420, partial [Candidatus Thorarchaeota archaeon]